eukprot:COSAG04_NODE_1595_length_6208_cov_1.762809_4_plen_96_part_00
MATACAFFPLGKCLRASAKPPPRKKGALRQRWIANGDPCRYVLRADVATELGSPALAGGKICKCCYDALPEPTDLYFAVPRRWPLSVAMRISASS